MQKASNMKASHIFYLLMAVLAAACQTAQPEEEPTASASEAVVSDYDSTLAVKYGADGYGMKSYVMAFLKSGPNRNQDEEEASELQKAHLENIGRMTDEGTLVFAGPTDDPTGDLRGIYIFDVSTVEEAEQLTSTDPAFKAGRLTAEYMVLYGSAALMAVNEIHPTLSKQSITDD